MDDNAAVFVISVAAQLAGMHPQTLRQYDRLGIVQPDRTAGRGRRYSQNDIRMLRQVQQLSQEEGISLEGIRRIFVMQRRIAQLEKQVEQLQEVAVAAQAEAEQARRVFAAGASGDVVALKPGSRPKRQGVGSSLVVWRPLRAIGSGRS